jgi:hypothetical protein
VLAPGSSDEADGSLHRALYYQHIYGSDAPAAAAAAAAANAHSSSSSRRNGDSYVGRRGPGGGGSGGGSSSYRWLEDAITEWQTSQGHMVVADALGPAAAVGHGGPSGGHLGGYTPQQVEEVKLVLRLLPVFCTTVLYW